MDQGRLELVHEVDRLRQITRSCRGQGRTVGFVPTMGALHRGHLRLAEIARQRADLVVVSVFVNPTQFGPGEDLDRYPRDLEGDLEACRAAGVDVLFNPAVETMYPPGATTCVTVPALIGGLCSAHRPGHFDGVATVVTKLFNLVGPCLAVFGRKDYQQLKVIERLAVDLAFDVEVIGVETVREDDGVALSSRNAYLSPPERQRARALVHGLSAACQLAASEAPPSAAEVRAAAAAPVEASLDSVDYVEVCHPDTLEPLDADAPVEAPTLVAIAGHLGATRLIDNLVLFEQSDPLG